MTHETAADRSAALLRQLDESRQQRDDLRHAPTCERPGVAHERGYSVTVTRCLGCGAVSTVRNTPSTTTKGTPS